MKVTHVPRHRSKTNAKSNTVICASIRPARNKPTDHQNNLHLIPAVKKTYHRRNASNSVKDSDNTPSSINVTKLYRDHQSVSQCNRHISKTNSSIKNSQLDNDLLKTLTRKKRRSELSKVAHYEDIVNDNYHHVYAKDAWLDRMGNTTDYHQNVKKKKNNKCFSRSVKIVIITAAVLGIVIMTILLVLLIKPKKATITVSIVILRWNKTGTTVVGTGIAGNGSDQLNRPLDAILDYENSLYVADTNNHRIQKYLKGASHGTTIAGNASGIAGTSLNDLKYPSQVLLVSNGDMFVTDTYNHRILKYSNGSPSGVLVAGVTGNSNISNNTLNYPFRIDYDFISNSLYIADYYNSRVMCYLSGASSGSLVAGGNGIGKNITQLYYPVGVYFDSLSNSLIIANHFAHNIVRWPLGATSWTLVAGDINGNNGSNATMLQFPTETTFDLMGNMYVADRNNQRIQLFLNGQTEGTTIAGVTGVNGGNSTLLYQPWSVKLDSQLNLYVADSSNHRIQKFMRY